MGIYVLKLSHGKFYVGRSNDIATRIDAHMNGRGSYWTRKYKVEKVLHPLKKIHGDDNLAEQAETIARMKLHGIDNVRGWLFTMMELGPEHRRMIDMLMTENDDLCRKCGQKGHYIMQCKQVEPLSATKLIIFAGILLMVLVGIQTVTKLAQK